MGQIISYLFGITGRTDDPDPVTGLTSKDIYLVKLTWHNLMKDPSNSGALLFLKLFEMYPQYKELFPFRTEPTENLPNNKRFLAHVNSFMYGFASIVDNIDKPDVLVALLMKQGYNHKPRGVADEAYWHLKNAAMAVFKTLMNEEQLNSWTKAFNVSIPIMIKGGHSKED